MRRVVLLATSILLAAPALAAAEWRELRTAHFRVLGDVPASRLRDVALRLEQFREVVMQLVPAAAGAGSAPVVVIAFADAQAYRPFMPVAHGRTVLVDGFFVDGADVNYITMNLEAGERAFPVIFHEFSHLLLNTRFPHAPLWFNEGLAEYFSTFEIADGGRRALVGKPIARHVALLQKRRLTLSQLFAIGPGSNEYTREGLERNLFYAQSWAMVHYARHGAGRRPASLEALARRLADGEDADASARSTYEMDLDALDAALQAYVRSEIYEHLELTFADGVTVGVNSEATALDDAEVDAWLADLLAHLQRGPEAIPLLQRALGERGDLPRALATLGVLRFRQGNRAEALSMLERAAAAGPDIESVQFVHGWALAMERADASKLPRAQAALERALALHPGYPAATQMLAIVYSSSGEFARTRDLLAPLVRATPDNQEAALLLAGALLGLGDVPAARALLGPILARPRDDESRERARTLLGEISKPQEQR